MTQGSGADPSGWFGAWLGVAALSGAVAAAEGPTNPRPLYLEIAKRYAAGDRAAAVTDVGRYSLRELKSEMEALEVRVVAPACPGCPTPDEPPPLRAIVMLHTDRDDLEAPPHAPAKREPPCGVRAHAQLAERAVALIHADARIRDFARRWYLAKALQSLAKGCLGDAHAWAVAGLRAFPRDADLLFASGTIRATNASLASQPRPADGLYTPSQLGRRLAFVQARSLELEAARKLFEQVLAVDPTREEARLHLARAHLQLGRPEEARKILESLLARSPTPAVLYLAHLFLGQVCEIEGRLEAAEQHYSAAFAQDPAQSSAVALSHLLQMKGESEEARAVLAGALREAPGRTVPDLYWVYCFGPGAAHTEMFERLREEAGR